MELHLKCVLFFLLVNANSRKMLALAYKHCDSNTSKAKQLETVLVLIAIISVYLMEDHRTNIGNVVLCSVTLTGSLDKLE